jgi:23S rRNA (cytosine1962-C5)-methyltransferase
LERERATLILKKGREKPVLNRHPWIFSGAIARTDGRPSPGDIVDVLASDGRWLARGYYNPRSQIQLRILSWRPEQEIDDDFWSARLEQAVGGRAVLALEPETTAYRLINAEADGLPGLIVDRYDDYLVIQCLTLGIDQRKEWLVDWLARRFRPAGVLERSDVAVRQKEGLTEVAGLRWGRLPPAPLVVHENGLQFEANLLEGHKTGLYLDQRDNRQFVCQPRFAAGREVLNVFAYTGGFAIYAAAAGAKTIINIEDSSDLLTQAQQNMHRNGFDRPQDEYIVGDAFQVLRRYRDTGRRFDLIILDPPKFAHSQRDVQAATRGYKDLNWLAMRLLRPGGLLATFSCSGLVSPELFQKVLFAAAVDAGPRGPNSEET